MSFFDSVINLIGKPYTNIIVNFHNGEVSDGTIEAASKDENRQIVAVIYG